MHATSTCSICNSCEGSELRMNAEYFGVFLVSFPCDLQVVAVGSGKADDKGNVVKSSLSVGDTVLYSKYSGVEFEVRCLPLELGSGLLFDLFSGVSYSQGHSVAKMNFQVDFHFQKHRADNHF